MIRVKLDPKEVAIAKLVGEMRNAESQKKKWRGQFGDRPPVERDIMGAIGELSVAKALDRYWSGIRSLSEADVGPYHVRFSLNENAPLYVRPKENFGPRWEYVLVTGAYGAYGADCVIRGGTNGHRAMMIPLTDPGGRGCDCHAVPQAALFDLEVDGHVFRRVGA